MINKLFICKVCGYDYGDYVWGESGKDPSFAICPCCGTEFGYHDSSNTAILAQRGRWLNRGAEWHCPEEMPKDWDLADQLKNLKSLS